MVPTCLPGGLCGEVGRKLLEDVGHLLLHEEANEVGGRVELQRQRAGKSPPPLLDGGLEGLAQGFCFMVCTLSGRRKGDGVKPFSDMEYVTLLALYFCYSNSSLSVRRRCPQRKSLSQISSVSRTFIESTTILELFGIWCTIGSGFPLEF